MFTKPKAKTAIVEQEEALEFDTSEVATVDLFSAPRALKKRLDYLSFFVIGAAALGATNLLVTLGLLFYVGIQTTQGAPTLVELADGKSVRVERMASKARSPEAVQEFTASTLTKLFDWRGNLPPSNPQEIGAPAPDPGVDIGGGAKVTTSTWAAGFALSETFRSEFLSVIASMTPKSLFGQLGVSRTQGVLVIRQVGEPKKLEPGKWTVDVVGNLILFENGDNVGKAIAFNKSVAVKAITPPNLPPQPTALQQTIYEARKSGLEIDGMQDLQI